ILQRYAWPGNIRELKNTVERAVIISEGDLIGPDSLSSKLTLSSLSTPSSPKLDGAPSASIEGVSADVQLGDMKEIVDSYEKQLIFC
ncbi:MAG: hypothetical protein AAGF51_05295, partial [Pseudomonadota bacterium]